MSPTTDISTMVIHTRTRTVDGMKYLRPQEVFDALPIETRNRIDLEDFKAVLTTSHLMFVELQRRQVERDALAHEVAITSVKRATVEEADGD